MKKKYGKSQQDRKPRQRVRRIERQAMEQAEQVQLPLGIEALAELARESLSSFASGDCSRP